MAIQTKEEWLKQNRPDLYQQMQQQSQKDFYGNSYAPSLDQVLQANPNVRDNMDIDLMFQDRPQFSSIRGSDGTLSNAYKLDGDKFVNQIKGVKLDNQGYDAFKKEALRDPSQQSVWQKLAIERQALDQQNAQQDLSRSQAGAAAQARSALAMRGGMAGGAALSLARQQARNLSLGQQNIARQGLSDRSNIGMQAEKMRTDMLSQLPGFETQRFNSLLGQATNAATLGADAAKYNMTNAINDLYSQNKYNLDTWNKKAETSAAYRNARATEENSK
jgi:hypothetical protein